MKIVESAADVFLVVVIFLMFLQSTMGIHPTAVILLDSQTWVSPKGKHGKHGKDRETHHPPQKDRETHCKNGSLILRLAGTWMYDDVCTMLDVCRFCFRYLLDIYICIYIPTQLVADYSFNKRIWARSRPPDISR